MSEFISSYLSQKITCLIRFFLGRFTIASIRHLQAIST